MLSGRISTLKDETGAVSINVLILYFDYYFFNVAICNIPRSSCLG